ncbi:hypothetical protein ARUL111621_08950 [Arthrobacter ulcerisalmonis]
MTVPFAVEVNRVPRVSGTPSLISAMLGVVDSSKKLQGQEPGVGAETTVVKDHEPPAVKAPPPVAVPVSVAVYEVPKARAADGVKVTLRAVAS